MANVKISGLPAATSITAGTDVAPLVSGGITTKATPQQIVNAGLLAPGAIGSGTASTGAFTTLSASSTVSGTGFSTYLASPPAIGGTAAAAGAFTTLSASSTVSGTGFSTYLLSPPAIGTTAPAAGKFTDLTSTGNTTIGDASTDTFTVYPATVSLINSTAITAASTKTLTLNGGAGSNGLVIDASNNVGIGTSSPTSKMQISGSVASSSSIALTITDTTANLSTQLIRTGSANSYAGTGPNETWLYSQGSSNLSLGPDGAASVKIVTNGFLRATFDSSGALTVPNIYSNTTASVTYVAVSSAGLLQRGGVSALKYKQDIRDLESIDINKFRPVRYKSKCENDDQTIDHFGFIADEVEEAGIKELITYNDDGKPEGFQYERMTVVLLKAIQELSSQVYDLKTELNELKAKVNVNV